MATPFDFSHLRAAEPDIETTPAAFRPGLAGQPAPANPFDFSHLRSGSVGGDLAPPKTGQQKAQDIARTAGIEVGPDFGSNVFDRAVADLGKGAATSIPGRLIGVATGTSETVDALGQLPPSQPMPAWIPDLDTIGTLVGDTAIFSLAPPLAVPGKIAGRALGKVVGSKLAALPAVENALKKGAWNHVALTQKLTTDLIGANANLFEAVGATTSAAIGFGGLVKVAGGEDQEAFIQGALAGVAVGIAPAFRALKAAAVLKRVTSEKYLQAEQALAESLDTGIGTMIAASVLPPSPEVAARISVSMMDAIDPALGRRALEILPILERPGTGIAGNIPQMRALGQAWEDVAKMTMRGPISRDGAAYRVTTGFFKSVDSTLRSLGPRGVQMSNLIKRSQDDAGVVFGELKAKVDKALKGVSKDDYDLWVNRREAGLATAGSQGTANATGVDRIAHLYDVEIPELLARHGIPLEGLTPGKYVSHYYEMAQFEKVVRSTDFISKLQSVLGKTYDEALDMRNSMLENVKQTGLNPKTRVLRPSIDMGRSFNITISEAKQLGLPLADNRFGLNRYIRQVADRVGFTKNFGVNFEKGQALLDDLSRTHSNKTYTELIDKSVRRSIGLDNEIGDFSQVFSWASNNVIVPQTLSLASISQVGQNTNTIAKYGMRHYLRGVNEYRKEAKLFRRFGGDDDTVTLYRGRTFDDIASSRPASGQRWFSDSDRLAREYAGPNGDVVSVTLRARDAARYKHGPWDANGRITTYALPHDIESVQTASSFHANIRAQVDEIGNAVGDFFAGAERANGILRPTAPGRTSTMARLNLGGFVLSKTGFNTMDDFNRVAAAYTGKSWLEESVKKGVRGGLSPKQLSRTAAEFKKLGLNFNEIVKRGALTSEETVRGAMRVSDITQFRIRPFDLPLYWSSPNAAAFRMLKTFAFNQARFINTEIWGSFQRYVATGGREGSARPMAFFLAGYPSVGLAIGSTRDVIRGESPFEGQTPLAAYATAHAWVGGVGILSDIAKAADGGSRAIFALGAGPAITWGVDFVEAGVKSIEDPNHFGRFITRHSLPGLSQNVGGSREYLNEALFPRRNQ